MVEVVVTGVGPLLASCADRHTLWRHLRDGPSQLAFEAAPGADGERWPIDHLAGGGRHTAATAGLAVSYGIGGHSAVTHAGKAEAA